MSGTTGWGKASGIFSLFLVVSVLLAAISTAHIAEARIPSSQVNLGAQNRYLLGEVACRAKPTNTSAILITLPNGFKVLTRGEASDGWQPVTCSGLAGYMPVSKLFVPKTKWVNTPDWRGSRCMAEPRSTSQALDFMEQGGVVQMRAPVTGSWTPVTCRSKAGYMLTHYLVDDRPAYAQTFYIRGTADRTGTYCRSTPSLSGSGLVLLPQGSMVITRGTASNGWMPITCSGRDGWVKTSYLYDTPPPQDTMYIFGAAGGVPCRAHATSSSTNLVTMREGDKVVSWEEITNGWTPVVCKGKYGYVPTKHLTATPPAKPWPLYVVGTPSRKGVSCRATPSSTGRIMMVIPERGKVLMRGEIRSGWWPVTCDGQAGWIDARYLSFSLTIGAAATTPVPTETPTPTQVPPTHVPTPTPTPTSEAPTLVPATPTPTSPPSTPVPTEVPSVPTEIPQPTEAPPVPTEAPPPTEIPPTDVPTPASPTLTVEPTPPAVEPLPTEDTGTPDPADNSIDTPVGLWSSHWWV